MPVQPGASYRWGAWVKTVSGSSGYIEIDTIWRDASGATISTSTPYFDGSGATGRVSSVLKAPANSATAVWRINPYSGGNRTFEVSEPKLIPVATLGTSLVRSDGTTVLADGDVVTALGTSSDTSHVAGVAAGTVNSNIASAATTSLWGGVTGTGKPADNATVGATWGTNVGATPSNLAALSGTEAIQNSLISLSGLGAGPLATVTSSAPYLNTNVTYAGLTDSKPPTNADNTAASVPTIIGNTNITINADYLGNITTTLPFDLPYTAKQGTTDVTSTTTFSLIGGGSLALTVNTNGNGIITVGSSSSGAGLVQLQAVYPNGATLITTITFTLVKAAAPPSTTTYGDLTSFSNVSSTTSVVNSSEVAVTSDSSGKLYMNLNFTFASVISSNSSDSYANICYATSSGGSLTDVFADTVPSETRYISGGDPGNIYLAKTQYTMPAANTLYYFKVKARTGGGAVHFTSSSVYIGQT